MLTVIREMAHAVSTHLAHIGPPAPLRRRRATRSRTQLLADVLEVATRAGEQAVERTPEQLDVLAEAGVVDAGAHGLVVILAGIVAGLRDDFDALPELPHHEPARTTRPHHFDSRFRYCTNFIVTGAGLDTRSFVAPARGDRRLRPRGRRRGDAQGPRPHRRARRRRSLSSRTVGDVQRLDVADMREQIAERERRAFAPAKSGARGGRGRRRACARCSRGSAPTWSTAARPSTRRPTRSSPGSTRSTCRGGPRAAQLPERDPGGRGGGQALGEARRGWFPSRSQQAALAALVELATRRATPRRTPSASRLRWRRSAPAPWRRPPGTTPQGRFVRGDAVGFAEGASSPGAAPGRRCRRRSSASPRMLRSSR